MGILLGLFTMGFWGTALFLAAIVSRKIGNILTLFWMQLFGFLLAAIYFIFNLNSFPFELIYKYLPVLLVVAIFQVIAYLSFYKGLEKGQVSLVSPIGASWSLITAILGVIFFKEVLNPSRLIAIFLIIAGVFAISIDISNLIKNKRLNLIGGMKEGIISMLCWGIALFLIVPSTKELGWFLPAFIFRFFLLGILGIFMLFAKKPFQPKSDKLPLQLLIPIGLLDVCAFFTYSLGVSHFNASIIAPISGSNTVITIFLASIFLKEKRSFSQILGIGGVVLGIILISI